MERVAAVVLAAGAGTRFGAGAGAHKLLAPFRGRPLVSWAVAAAAGAGLGAVVVVSGAVDLGPALRPGAGVPDDVAVVVNDDWARGQATSLAAGIGWCRAHGFDAAVFGLGDQPLVPASAWRAVGTAGDAPVVSAVYAGRRRPPVRLHRSVWGLLSADGDEGARELMRRRPDLVGEVACEGDPADVDTLEDLRRFGDGPATPAGTVGAPGTAGAPGTDDEWR